MTPSLTLRAADGKGEWNFAEIRIVGCEGYEESACKSCILFV